MQIELVNADGSRRRIVADDYRASIGERWSNLMGSILANSDEHRKREQLRAVWRLIAAGDPTLAEGTLVRFESVETWFAPRALERPARTATGDLRARPVSPMPEAITILMPYRAQPCEFFADAVPIGDGRPRPRGGC